MLLFVTTLQELLTMFGIYKGGATSCLQGRGHGGVMFTQHCCESFLDAADNRHITCETNAKQISDDVGMYVPSAWKTGQTYALNESLSRGDGRGGC